MISVIVPVYKVEAYLDRCVKSILAQTYTDFEVILVDDGSPDRCGEMCDGYTAQDSRVRVIHQENAGVSSARNAGLEKCQGEYVCFVDADDETDPQTLEILHQAMIRGDYDIAFCGHRNFQEGETLPAVQLRDVQTKELSSAGLWAEVFGRLNNAPWGKMYKRALIGELRFPLGLSLGEDFLFNLHYIGQCKNGVTVNAPLYHYFKRSDSATKSSFRPSRLDEIATKDLAREIVRAHQPNLMDTAQVYCFRARMNVLRSMYQSGCEGDYPQQEQDCAAYAKTWYPAVRRRLRLKERAEYLLFRVAKPVYRRLTKKRT